jgi:predicted ATP-grasp superfamily ATP-dependent carboligase
MNLFYTGLGIARSLGARGIPVTGLTTKRGVYGNYTRYAEVLLSPDSRSEPEALLAFLLKIGRDRNGRAIIFPTRDDDLVFLDRFRAELEPYYRMVLPPQEALNACLNKWFTYLAAREAGVSAPECWLVERPEDLQRVMRRVIYPCVLKAVSAHHWRQGRNWELVGARKAIGVSSEAELIAAYEEVAQADQRALIQEMVVGGDESILIVACYFDQKGKWAAGFNTQKLVQIPAGFGTGCIVQSVERPELFERTRKLLEQMGYKGIAEVEYKWDAVEHEFKLIEVNPRPWDQHRLGYAAGVDVIYTAYCDHAELAMPEPAAPAAGHKWIAEDTFVTAAVRSLSGGVPRIATLLGEARGKRIYAIWSASDPLPSLVWGGSFVLELIGATWRAAWAALRRKWSVKAGRQKKELVYETPIEKSERAG